MYFNYSVTLVSLVFSSSAFAIEPSNQPDRNFSVDIHLGDSGIGIAYYPTKNIAIELGYSVFTGFDKGFEIDGYEPTAYANYTVAAGGNFGLTYVRPFLSGALTPQDELTYRVSARFRPLALYSVEVSTISIFEGIFGLSGEYGMMLSTPLTVGVGYTYWALPRLDAPDSLMNNLVDLGVEMSLDIGAHIINYSATRDTLYYDTTTDTYTYYLPSTSTEKVSEFSLGLYWLLKLGVVI